MRAEHRSPGRSTIELPLASTLVVSDQALVYRTFITQVGNGHPVLSGASGSAGNGNDPQLGFYLVPCYPLANAASTPDRQFMLSHERCS